MQTHRAAVSTRGGQGKVGVCLQGVPGPSQGDGEARVGQTVNSLSFPVGAI